MSHHYANKNWQEHVDGLGCLHHEHGETVSQPRVGAQHCGSTNYQVALTTDTEQVHTEPTNNQLDVQATNRASNKHAWYEDTGWYPDSVGCHEEKVPQNQVNSQIPDDRVSGDVIID